MNGLILGGGGSNGDWQAGRTLAIVESGVKFGVIGGTSVGSLNGLGVATEQTQLLDPIWTTLKNNRVYNTRSYIRVASKELLHRVGIGNPYEGLMDSSPLRELLDKHFLGKECKIDYLCSVVVVGDNEPNTYMKYQIAKGDTITSTDLDYVWGSTLIPIVFDPVVINGKEVVDGGLLKSSPISHTVRHFPVTKMTAVSCQPITDIPVERPRGIIDRFVWTTNAMLRNQFLSDWKQMDKWNQASLQCPTLTINELPVKYIEQDLHFPEDVLGSPLNFDKSKTALNFYMGYNSFKER
jgi:predicted acylesterase/phospholipase RssA